MTEDGKPYGPFRYKEIVKERYIISKRCNTSYTDVGDMTPREKNYLLEFIADEIQKEEEAKQKLIEKQKEQIKHKKR